MNPERYMVTGIDSETGEKIEGFYSLDRYKEPMIEELHDAGIDEEFGSGRSVIFKSGRSVILDSIEPVAAKVKVRFQSNDEEFAGHCPNCDKNVHSWTGEYCPGCGQRLDWSDI